MASEPTGDHRHSVLIVEDDYDTRESIVDLVHAVGLNAVAADNGRAALQLLRDGFRPCLIVLDMAMPDMDGFTFRREQLADPTIADVPVAVMSGGGWAVEADARKLGLMVFLRKPVAPDQLFKTFDDHCGARRAN
jgi:CheY-like chemotaxis protein